MNDNKERAEHLLNQLAPDQIAALVHVMEVMLDRPSRQPSDAAVEDEAIGLSEEQAVSRSKEWFQHNEGISFEQVVAELGFTMEQIWDYRPNEEQKDPAG